MIMAVDPGSTVSGVAVLDEKALNPLVLAFSLRPKKSTPDYIIKSIIYVAHKYKITDCYIEKSAYMGDGSSRGHAVATRGDLVTLSMFIGSLVFILRENGIVPHLVEVIKWKGTLPKKVCNDRVIKKLSLKPGLYNDHELDAIGIGLYALGKF